MKRNYKFQMRKLLEILVISTTLWQSILAGPTTISSDKLISYQINGKKPLRSLNDMFLSFTIEPNTLKHVISCNLTSVTTTMVQSLAPAYIRLAGPRSNELVFQTSPSYQTTNNKFLVTGPEWQQVNEYFSTKGLRVIAGLSNGMENKPNEPDFSNILKMISFSDKNNISVDWQMGYELQEFSKTRGKEMGQNLASLKRVLQVFPRYRSSSLIGPDMTGYDRREDISFLRNFMSEARNSLDVFTWHPFSDPEDENVMEILNSGLSSLDNWLWMKDGQKPNFKGVTPRKPIWIAESETKPRESNLSQTTTWVKRLGAAAQLGISVYLRKPHLMTIYEPTSEYWFAILYKSLVSKYVLDIRSSENSNSMVQTFSHCTQILENPEESIINPNIVYQRGSVTIYGVNTSPEPARLRFKLNSKTDEKAHLYILTEDNNELFPRTLFNKQLLSLSLENELPILSPKIRLSPKYLFLPSRSIFFIIFPEAKSQACLHQKAKTKNKLPQEEIFQAETFADDILEIIEDKDALNEKYVNYRSQIKKSVSPSQTANENVNTKFVTYSDDTWMSSFPEKLKEVLTHDKESESNKKEKSKSEMYRILAQAILGNRNVSSERNSENHESRNVLKISSRLKRMPKAVQQPYHENEKSPRSEMFVMPLDAELFPESVTLRSVPVMRFINPRDFANQRYRLHNTSELKKIEYNNDSNSSNDIQQLTSHLRNSKIYKRSTENKSSMPIRLIDEDPDNISKSSEKATTFIPDLYAIENHSDSVNPDNDTSVFVFQINRSIRSMDMKNDFVGNEATTRDDNPDNMEKSEEERSEIPDFYAIENQFNPINYTDTNESLTPLVTDKNTDYTEQSEEAKSTPDWYAIENQASPKLQDTTESSTTLATDNNTDYTKNSEETKSETPDWYAIENQASPIFQYTTENLIPLAIDNKSDYMEDSEKINFTPDLYAIGNPRSAVNSSNLDEVENFENTKNPERGLLSVQSNRSTRSMGLKNDSLQNSNATTSDKTPNADHSENFTKNPDLEKTTKFNESENSSNKTKNLETTQKAMYFARPQDLENLTKFKNCIKTESLKNSMSIDKTNIDEVGNSKDNSFSSLKNFNKTVILDHSENRDETNKSVDIASDIFNTSNSSNKSKNLSEIEQSSESKDSNQTSISDELKSSTSNSEFSNNKDSSNKSKEFVQPDFSTIINNHDSKEENKKTPNSSTPSKLPSSVHHPIIFKTTKIVKEIIYPEITNDITSYLEEIIEDFEDDLSKRRKREANDAPVKTLLTNPINKTQNLKSRLTTSILKNRHNKNLINDDSHIKKLDKKSIFLHATETTTSPESINKPQICHKKLAKKHTSIHVETEPKKSSKHTHRLKREAVDDIKNFFSNVGSETEKHFKTFVHWFGKRTEEFGSTLERVKRRITDVFVSDESESNPKETLFLNITEQLFHDKLIELSAKLDSLLKSMSRTQIGEKHHLLFELEQILEETIKAYENFNKTSDKNQSSTVVESVTQNTKPQNELKQETKSEDDQNQSSTALENIIPLNEPKEEMKNSENIQKIYNSENQNEVTADNRQKRETSDIDLLREKIKWIQDALYNKPISEEISQTFKHFIKDHIPKQPIIVIPLHQNSSKFKNQLLEDLKIKIEAYKRAVNEKLPKHPLETKLHLHKRDTQNPIDTDSDSIPSIPNATDELNKIINDWRSVPAARQQSEDEESVIYLGDLNTMPNEINPTQQDYEEQRKMIKDIFNHISLSQYEAYFHANHNREKRDEILQKVNHMLPTPQPTHKNTLKPENQQQDLKSKIQDHIENLKKKVQELKEKIQTRKNERSSGAHQLDPEDEYQSHESQFSAESPIRKRNTRADWILNKIETTIKKVDESITDQNENRKKRDSTSDLHKPRHEKFHQSPSTSKSTSKFNNQLQDLKARIQTRVENLPKKTQELKSKNRKIKIKKHSPRARENAKNEFQGNETQPEMKSHLRKRNANDELLIRSKRYSTLYQLTKDARQPHKEKVYQAPTHQIPLQLDQRLQDLKAKIQEHIENLKKKAQKLKNKRHERTRQVDPINKSRTYTIPDTVLHKMVENSVTYSDKSRGSNNDPTSISPETNTKTENRKKRESIQDVHKLHQEKSKSSPSPCQTPLKPNKQIQDLKAKIQAHVQNLRDKAQKLKNIGQKIKTEKLSPLVREVNPGNEFQLHQTPSETESHLRKRDTEKEAAQPHVQNSNPPSTQLKRNTQRLKDLKTKIQVRREKAKKLKQKVQPDELPKSKSHLHKRDTFDDLKRGFKTASSKTTDGFKSFSNWLFGDNGDQKKDNEPSKRQIPNSHYYATQPDLKSSNGNEVYKNEIPLAIGHPLARILNSITFFLNMIFSNKNLNKEGITNDKTNHKNTLLVEKIFDGENSANRKNTADQPTTQKEDEISNEIRRKRATVHESPKKDIIQRKL